MSDESKSADVLIQGYLEETLTESECAQLLTLLKGDPTKIRLVLHNLRMDALLREVVGETGLATQPTDQILGTLRGSGSAPAPGAADGALAVRVGHVESSPVSSQSRATPSARARTAAPEAGALPKASVWMRLRQRGHILAFAASVALAIGLSLWLFPSANHQPTLTILPGTQVALERAGQSLPAADGLKLLPGDRLRVSGTNGAAINYGQENTRVTLNDQAELKILAWTKGKRLELRQGKVQATAARQRLWSPMILVTARAEARVLGTQFSLGATTDATRLDVTEGRVRFTRRSDEAAVKVSAGNYAVATSNSDLAALPFTGRVRREWWSGVSDGSLEEFRVDPRYPSQPDGSDWAPTLELQPVQTNQLSVRFCGYVHPPVTGDYEFWIAGGPQAALFMSPSEEPTDLVRIAALDTASRNFDRPRFQSAVSPWAPPVPLVAGRRYYIEALVLIKNGKAISRSPGKFPATRANR